MNSQETILVSNPGGSQGDLCIGSLALGRHVNDIANSGAAGTASLALDLANVPTNLALTAVVAGETWYWQAWYRDESGGMPTSNLSSAVGVTFSDRPSAPWPDRPGARPREARASSTRGASCPGPNSSSLRGGGGLSRSSMETTQGSG